VKPGPQPISAERLHEVFDYDAETGHFTRRSTNKRAGCFHLSSGYWVMKINYRQVLAHRLAWLWVHGEWHDDLYVDHINRNKLDNRIANLRLATHGQNYVNSLAHNNQTGFKGVQLDKRIKHSKRYFSTVKIDGKMIYLPYCDTPEEAAENRRLAAIEVYGEFVP
jgi:hypothetical protein